MKFVMQHWGCRPIIIYSNYGPSVWSRRHLYEKKEIIYYLKTIAAYDLKVGRCIGLNDLMKLHDYCRSRSLCNLVKASGSRKEKINTTRLGQMTKMVAMPI